MSLHFCFPVSRIYTVLGSMHSHDCYRWLPSTADRIVRSNKLTTCTIHTTVMNDLPVATYSVHWICAMHCLIIECMYTLCLHVIHWRYDRPFALCVVHRMYMWHATLHRYNGILMCTSHTHTTIALTLHHTQYCACCSDIQCHVTQT